VSPAAADLAESVAALKYANRARNIQNRPVVSRDPALVLLDGLKTIVQVRCWCVFMCIHNG
jgi:kinesin family protein 4/21/27